MEYGFVDAGAAEDTFAVTSDYADIARNHCAATMLTNALMRCCPAYAGSRGARQVFREIHRIVGNGPVLWLSPRANRYLRRAGLPISCVQVNRRPGRGGCAALLAVMRAALADGRPCAALVAASILHWHWILVLSIEYDHAGDASLLISDGWTPHRVFRYVPDRGSLLMAAVRFDT